MLMRWSENEIYKQRIHNKPALNAPFSLRYLFLFISDFHFTYLFSTLLYYLHLWIVQQGKLPITSAVLCVLCVLVFSCLTSG